MSHSEKHGALGKDYNTVSPGMPVAMRGHT